MAVVLVRQEQQRSSSSSSSSRSGGGPFRVTSLKSSSKSSSVFGSVSFADYFTVNRKGYATLPYFGASKDPVLTYSVLGNYDMVIEPYADMQLAVSEAAARSVALSLVKTYVLEVCTTDDEVVCYSGSYDVGDDVEDQTPAVVPCAAYDELTVTIHGYSSKKEEIMSATATALCLYVRREINALTKDDREETMDTMYTLWKVRQNCRVSHVAWLRVAVPKCASFSHRHRCLLLLWIGPSL